MSQMSQSTQPSRASSYKRAYKPSARRLYSGKAARKRTINLARRTPTVIARSNNGSFTGTTSSFMPSQIRVSLNYHQWQQAVAISTAPEGSFEYFRLNNPTDPDVAIGSLNGHQPMGFDEMGKFYQNCVVTAAKVKVLWIPKPGSGVLQCTMRPYVKGDTTPNVLNDEVERSNSLCWTVDSSNPDPQPKVMYVKIWKLLGYASAQEYESDEANIVPWQNSTYTLGNGHEAILATACRTLQGADTSAELLLTITMYIKFTDRRLVSPS